MRRFLVALMALVLGLTVVAAAAYSLRWVLPERGSTASTPPATAHAGTREPTVRATAAPSSRAAVGPAASGSVTAPTATVRARASPGPTGSRAVAWVSDGDSIVIADGERTERVRLIGIDAPERSTDCFGVESSAALKALLAGQTVQLDRDPGQPDRDRYGRLLRRVVLPDGVDAARAQLEAGMAVVLIVGQGHTRADAYAQVEASARAAHRGLWAACPVP